MEQRAAVSGQRTVLTGVGIGIGVGFVTPHCGSAPSQSYDWPRAIGSRGRSSSRWVITSRLLSRMEGERPREPQQQGGG